MKPAVVAQDEMFPDGDAGWMEMDEVLLVSTSEFQFMNFRTVVNKNYSCSKRPHGQKIILSYILFSSGFSIWISPFLGSIRRWHVD